MAAIEFAVRRLASDSASIQPALAPSTRASDLQALRAEEARQERRAQPGQQAMSVEGTKVTISERARELAAQQDAEPARNQQSDTRRVQEREAVLQMPQLSDQVLRTYASAT
ncbi:hypothetical protein GCM10027019_20670 [Melaminivora jejuensis]|uniref:hypothetical protein n=1 Tax=Melaminivora jejuensis TaxID=1267217 RepID=UPI001ADFA898|nr:hypothetical protein [Melaminivora jejuensis]UHJ64754.1 hypothetical protein LVC68_15755 [Melaminivora jejuensis]